MPIPPTIAEREAELAALQSAFDEYITSSRELEEELDAELAKMQEKLAESSAANAALSSQLENIAPQLSSLEKALTETRHKLELEQKARRTAEMAQDEAEARCRESEGLVEGLRDDCDAAHEELAFRESELEETKLELEVERERHRVEMEEMQQELQMLQQQSQSAQPTQSNQTDGGDHNHQNGQGPVPSTDTDDDDAFLSGDDMKDEDDYVKRLEDELELVTEQLIETEQRLTQAEDQITTLKETKTNGNNSMGDVSEHAPEATVASTASNRSEDQISMEKELLALKEDHHRKEEQLMTMKEELELAHEELQLVQEELKAAEEDSELFEKKMDGLRSEHRDECAQLRSDLESAQTEARSSLKEVETLEETIQSSIQETTNLRDEIDQLNIALSNAKQDHANVLEELEQVNARFDEVRDEAQKHGRESAEEEIRAALGVAHQAEVVGLQNQIKELTENNVRLQQGIDAAEMAVAAAKDAGSAEQSESVKKLRDQLARSKEDFSRKELEATELRNALETRVTKAEVDVTRLERELSQTKGKLAEAEAHLIVSKRENARIPKKQVSKRKIVRNQKTFENSIDENEPVKDSSYGDGQARSRRVREASGRRARSSSPTTPQRLRQRLAEEETKSNELQSQYNELKEQNRMDQAQKKRLEDDLKSLQKQLFNTGDGEAPVVTQMSRISALATPRADGADTTFSGDQASSMDEIIKSGDTDKVSEEFRNMEKKFAMQREYNAQLLSKILSLQGNIQVCCRVRPMRVSEFQKGFKGVIEPLSETELGCFDSRSSKWKSFAFDKVWGPDQTQQSIFQDVEPLALSVVDGYNACIFAYGQTGSGKTYTMEGQAEGNNYGISYRTIQKVFTLLKLRAAQQKMAANAAIGEEKPKAFTFQLQIGMLEIYNDEIFDLLSATAQAGSKADQKRAAKEAGVKATLDIRRSPEGTIEVPGLTKEKVESIQDVMNLLKKGNNARATAATDLNEHSSRSHMVLAVEVASGLDGQPGNKGTLYLVDLAGSERVRKSKVEGDQLKEASHINKSLSALGNVMEALDRKASHVPYRDSKLTHLLQDSLGGNSRTMMVVTCCPHNAAYDESVYALQFATRVRRIQIGAAKRNVTSKNLEETVKALTSEMKALTKAKEKSEGQLNSLKKDNTRIQDKLQNLSQQRQKSQSDSRTLEILRKNNNEMAGRWQKEKTLRERAQEELEKNKTTLRKKDQEVMKLNREKETLNRKLEDKENQLSKASRDLREAKDASSAAVLRARKAQLVASRNPRPSISSPKKKSSNPITGMTITTTTPMSNNNGNAPKATADKDVVEVRKQVLALLEKYDKAKIDRIDIIMEKFKGKENILVEKMKQRYEGAAAAAAAAGTTTTTPASVSIHKRSEVALQRHKERMQKRLEAQKNGK